jgi:Fe2+ or Zn2+ uptake regulation protein
MRKGDSLMAHLLKRQPATLSQAVRDLAEQLTESGYKVTSPRLGVLDAAVDLGGSFTAADIERWLAERDRSPGAASIFRALKLLTELGLMQRIHGVEECHRYTLSSGHAHRVVCTSCGNLVAFDGCELAALAQQLEQRTGYSIQAHLLEFFGQCPACRVRN